MLIAIATALQLRPIHPLFAVEVGNVDLKHVDDDTFARLRAAFEEYSVLVFHDQRLTDDEQIAWDNRAMLHRGRAWDYAKHRRVMHRTTVAGEGPTA
jgi:alpha-ketoglutarate-dependent taurine dioxygenase